jgi:hypothetical protein
MRGRDVAHSLGTRSNERLELMTHMPTHFYDERKKIYPNVLTSLPELGALFRGASLRCLPDPQVRPSSLNSSRGALVDPGNIRKNRPAYRVLLERDIATAGRHLPIRLAKVAAGFTCSNRTTPLG